MTGELIFSSRWWAWWSNPLIAIHEEHRVSLPLTKEQLDNIDYFNLLQLRSTLQISGGVVKAALLNHVSTFSP